MKMIEVWKDIEGYEGHYQVSNIGRIKSVRRTVQTKQGDRNISERILKKIKIQTGYNQVMFSVGGVKKACKVSRLVASAFIDNPENKPQVNHINENKTDDRCLNLEWVTAKENINHGTAISRMIQTQRNTRCKKVYQYTTQDQFVREWISVSEAARNGFSKANISQCCMNKRKSHKNYKWSYEKI